MELILVVLALYVGKRACLGPHALESPALGLPGKGAVRPENVCPLQIHSFLILCSKHPGSRSFLPKRPASGPVQASFLVSGVWVKVGPSGWGFSCISARALRSERKEGRPRVGLRPHLPAPGVPGVQGFGIEACL